MAEKEVGEWKTAVHGAEPEQAAAPPKANALLSSMAVFITDGQGCSIQYGQQVRERNGGAIVKYTPAGIVPASGFEGGRTLTNDKTAKFADALAKWQSEALPIEDSVGGFASVDKVALKEAIYKSGGEIKIKTRVEMGGQTTEESQSLPRTAGNPVTAECSKGGR